MTREFGIILAALILTAGLALAQTGPVDSDIVTVTTPPEPGTVSFRVTVGGVEIGSSSNGTCLASLRGLAGSNYEDETECVRSSVSASSLPGDYYEWDHLGGYPIGANPNVAPTVTPSSAPITPETTLTFTMAFGAQPGIEFCGNGIDDDGDGSIDEGCPPGPLGGNDVTLQVTLGGTGSGGVTSQDGLINCPGDCTEIYPAGTDVTLTASEEGESEFSSWGGACASAGSNPNCQINVGGGALVPVTAVFSQPACPGGQVSPHSACEFGRCVSVPGCGVNACTFNRDCFNRDIKETP